MRQGRGLAGEMNVIRCPGFTATPFLATPGIGRDANQSQFKSFRHLEEQATPRTF